MENNVEDLIEATKKKDNRNIYKKTVYQVENGQKVVWNRYFEVKFPDGQVMDEETHDFTRDGFFWSAEPPTEYLEWLETQNEMEL